MNTTPSKTLLSPTPSLVHIGLDVSKDTLDVCLLKGDKRHEKQFANDKAAHRSLLAWAERLAGGASCHFCLEATGSYSQEIALFLVEQAQHVSVINPARIRFFGLACNAGNKTDKADARLIALYSLQQNPPAWNKPLAQVQLLQALVRRLHALNDLLTQEKNRAQVPGQDKCLLASSKRIINALEKEKVRLQSQLQAHIHAHEELERKANLLQSIPGIGQITAWEIMAWEIMAEMPDVEEFQSAQSAAAYAGLSPREQRSGTSVRKATHLSKRGSARLRRAFYFPAVCALRWNPAVRAHYERLRAAGKPKMVAVAACMRKLLMICYGVLKHQRPFDPAWQSQLQLNPSS